MGVILSECQARGRYFNKRRAASCVKAVGVRVENKQKNELGRAHTEARRCGSVLGVNVVMMGQK